MVQLMFQIQWTYSLQMINILRCIKNWKVHLYFLNFRYRLQKKYKISFFIFREIAFFIGEFIFILGKYSSVILDCGCLSFKQNIILWCISPIAPSLLQSNFCWMIILLNGYIGFLNGWNAKDNNNSFQDLPLLQFILE